jgi:hypothetical protein
MISNARLLMTIDLLRRMLGTKILFGLGTAYLCRYLWVVRSSAGGTGFAIDERTS